MNPVYGLLDRQAAHGKKDVKASVFGTLEWASHNINFISGCKHDCKYCYSKAMAIRFGRKTADAWKDEIIRENNLRRRYKKLDGTIMFPSAHDIHPGHLSHTLEILENILLPGNKVLIVTKPHLECIQAICKTFFTFSADILFRFTIGSARTVILKFWEPGAPSFGERFESLKYAFDNGFQTSVSCEPMLDDNIEEVVENVRPFVTDAIWLGKANSLIRRLQINQANDCGTMAKARHLMECQTDEYIKSLYYRYKDDRKIKWKESIKRIVGLEIPTQKGLDI